VPTSSLKNSGYGEIELSSAYVATSQTLTWTLGV
jgi:hypothetical protein